MPTPETQGLTRIQSDAEGWIRLELLGFVHFPPGLRGQLHAHRCWEIVFIGAGKGTLACGSASTACSTHDILIIPPGESHQFTAGPGHGMEHFYIGFSSDFLPEGIADSHPPMTLPPGPGADLIRSELKSIHVQARQSKVAGVLEYQRFKVLPVVGRIIELLTGSCRLPEGGRRSAKEPLVESIKDHLSANLGARMSVKELARHFCLSPKYFGEIFKKHTGLNLREYLNDIRMARALDWIRTRESPVSAIAEELGFSDRAYFSRLFRAHHGMTPSQARGHRA